MNPIYEQSFPITDNCVNCFGRLKNSMILYFAQEVAGRHFAEISMDYEALAEKGMFWAIIRQKVQITRLPQRGETIHVQTWPMPTTRVAYPRSVVAYDEAGNECFRSISLWVLMDLNSRAMILPAKSGISVNGTLRGNELASPASLGPKLLSNQMARTVRFTDLDRNAHMNNTKYLDWIDDLLPAAFHAERTPKEVTVCYLSEAREGQELAVHWDFLEDGCFQTDIHRPGENKDERIFSARILY
jgi:acyl-ACP thioesterase